MKRMSSPSTRCIRLDEKSMTYLERVMFRRYGRYTKGDTDVLCSYLHAVVIDLDQVGSLDEKREIKFRSKRMFLIPTL